MFARILLFYLTCLVIVSCDSEYAKWDLDEVVRPPKVTTVAVRSVYTSAAEIDIRLDWDGNATIQKIGVCYGLESEPTIESGNELTDGGDEIRTARIQGLQPSTLYYARAFAENEAGVSYGSIVTFTTNPIAAPTVQTSQQASNIGVYSATVGGTILSDGGLPITAKGICYSATSVTPTISGSTVNAGTGNEGFALGLTGLQSSTNYYARAFATNSQGTSYGETISFSTLEAPAALVATNNCSSLNGFTANITFWGGQNYETAPMCIITSGYSGSCIGDCASNPLAASVQFNRTFSDNGFIRFRSRAHEGNGLRIPTVLVDGVSISITDLTPYAYAYDWHHIKTANISAGSHTIRIHWPQTVTYYDYSVDEIEFWE
jgi:hypothetical protein